MRYQLLQLIVKIVALKLFGGVFIKSKMCASSVRKLHKSEVPVTAEDELMYVECIMRKHSL